MNDISNCSNTATLSVLENTKWMGKKFTINEFGNLQKQSNGLFIKGKVLPLEIMTSLQLKILTDNLQANHALCLTNARWQRWCDGLWEIKSKNDE